MSSNLELEVEIYKNIPLENKETFSDFWHSNEKNLVNLRKVARHVLTPPATSCPSERAFSTAGYQIWARRNRLSGSSVERIMFLIGNLDDDFEDLELPENYILNIFFINDFNRDFVFKFFIK